MKKILTILLICFSLPALCQQADRRDVRQGNRKYRKDNFKDAEISYRKALVKDSTSFAGNYNLASSLYRQKDYQNSGKSLERLKDQAPIHPAADRYYFNQGDVALQNKDYAGAVEAFRQSLLRNPGDMDAKESYIYAKKMLENQQQNGGGGSDNQNQDQQNQDQQNQDQQDQNQNQQDQNQQNQDQQDQNQDQQDQDQQPQPKISPQQANQMLQAMQAKEKETQDKVNKEKAAALQSRQKEKNW